MAEEQKAAPESVATEAPNFIALVTLSQELSESYIDLKDQFKNLENIEQNEEFFQEFENQLNEITERIRESQKNESITYGELLDIRLKLKMMRYNLQSRMGPVDKMLANISAQETKWAKHKKSWDQLNKAIKGAQSKVVLSLSQKSDEIITNALKIISEKLEILISEKLNGAELDSKIYKQITLIDALVAQRRALFIFGESPIMFSPQYFSQFNLQLFREAGRDIKEISLPDKSFFLNEWPVILFQLFLTLFLAGMILYFRSPAETKTEEKHLRDYPFSVGLVFSIAGGFLFYSTYPPIWHICMILIAWAAVARLLKVFVASGTKRWLIYWLIISLITSTILGYMRFPIPLYSLFFLLFSIIGAFISYTCFKEVRKKEGSIIEAIGFIALALILILVLLLLILGFTDFSNLLFNLMIRMISIIYIAGLFIFISEEGARWVVYHSPFKNTTLFVTQGTFVLAKTQSFIYLLAASLVCIVFLVSWNIFDTPKEAFEGISSLGVSIGDYHLTIGKVLSAVLTIYTAYFISWIIQTLIKYNFFKMINVLPDIGQSIGKIIHYMIMITSILLVLLMMGLSLTNLTILAGSLGIGIGMGLQDIVKNFAAGILLLFERPLRVGDTIEFEGGPCRVKRIGLRATLIQTKTETEIVIPNNNLISNPLMNWTLSQKRYRLKFPLGVAYHSDVDEVMRIMKECGESSQGVLKSPPPQVLFMEFGPSSLNFEMRVWIYDVQNRRTIQTEINQELEKRLRMAGISIAYPQLDVHIHD